MTRTFLLATASGAEVARQPLDQAVAALYENTGIDVRPTDVHIWMGEAFDVVIPRSSIKDCQRVPDHRPGGSLGVHGARGTYLVNATYDNLVSITVSPRATATLRLGTSLPPAVRENLSWYLRPFLRDRAARIRRLTVSVDDPDGLVRELAEG
jgi:hypothetical protein